MPKKVTNEELARMMAKGFEETATKDDLKNLATKAEVVAIKRDLENIELRMGHLAYAFDVKDLKKRMIVIERKIGLK